MFIGNYIFSFLYEVNFLHLTFVGNFLLLHLPNHLPHATLHLFEMFFFIQNVYSLKGSSPTKHLNVSYKTLSTKIIKIFYFSLKIIRLRQVFVRNLKGYKLAESLEETDKKISNFGWKVKQIYELWKKFEKISPCQIFYFWLLQLSLL